MSEDPLDFHNLESIFHYVELFAPHLPLFRSDAQAEILATLFLGVKGDEPTLTELAARVGRPPSSVHREIQRLERAGIVTTRRRGNLRVVSPNTEAAYYHDLEGLLLRSVGPVPLLSTSLRDVSGIEAAYIFGSWAARYNGEPGDPPRDIDLLIIGTPDPAALYDACADAEQALSIEVNPTILDHEAWAKPRTEFTRRLKNDVSDGHLVAVDIRTQAGAP